MSLLNCNILPQQRSIFDNFGAGEGADELETVGREVLRCTLSVLLQVRQEIKYIEVRKVFSITAAERKKRIMH
jgi:hypothetical protein